MGHFISKGARRLLEPHLQHRDTDLRNRALAGRLECVGNRITEVMDQVNQKIKTRKMHLMHLFSEFYHKNNIQ